MKETKETKEKLPGFLPTFTAGVKKGCNLFLNVVLPSVVIAYAIVQFMNLAGIMPVLGKLLSPVMAIFGLPGEAAVPLAIGVISMGGGMGSVTAMVQSGVLTTTHAAMMAPYFFLSGSIFLYSGRIIAVTGIDIKDQKYIYMNTVLAGILSLIVMRVVLLFI